MVHSKQPSRHERGQALVIIVIGMIVMLAFTAMAIDGGMVYSDRRDAQNAADQAALAGALAYIQAGSNQSNAAIGAATTSATANGYTDGVNGDAVAVAVNVPTAGTLPNQKDTDRLVEVEIETTTQTALIQLFTTGTFRHSVKAVARASDSSGGGGGNNALLSMGTDCNSRVQIVGSGQLTIDPGGIHVNSTCNDAFDVSGGAQVNADWITLAASGNHIVGGTVNPPPQQNAAQVADPYAGLLSPPTNPYGSCSGGWVGVYSVGTSTTINPGCYAGVGVSGGGYVELNPGVYVFQGNIGVSGNGSTFRVKPGGTIIIAQGGVGIHGTNTTTTLAETMIYLAGGTYDVSGNGLVIHHSAPTSGDYQGISMYCTNGNDIVVSGDTGTTLQGTYYAPQSRFQVVGSGESIHLDAQIIGRWIQVAGNGILNISWSGGASAGGPPVIDLVE